jgi:3-oxoacyl-[acyl-carrier protein] reductase
VVCGRAFNQEAHSALKSNTAVDAKLTCASGDVCNLDDHPCFVNKIFEAFGRLDCPVNNAGVSVKVHGGLLKISPDS